MTRSSSHRAGTGGLPAADGAGVRRIRPAHEQVADQLRSLILSGGLARGERPPVEARRSASFGVPRIPVRDPLCRLATQGPVHAGVGSGSGTFVAAIDQAAVSEQLKTGLPVLGGNDGISPPELFKTRALLEIPAARHSATRRNSEHVGRLTAALGLERSVTMREERFEEGRQFHAVQLAAADKRLLMVLAASLFTVIRARFLGHTQSHTVREQIDADHAEILAGVEVERPDQAAAAMCGHLDRLRQWYEGAGGRRPAGPSVSEPAR